MARLPWILVLFMATAANNNDGHHRLDPIKIDNHDCQTENNVRVVLNGSVVGIWDSYNWRQTSHHDGVEFEHTNKTVVNVTVPRSINCEDRTFKFKLAARDRNRHTSLRNHRHGATAAAAVHFKEYSSEGVRLFATKVVYTLLKLHYDYIVLTYRHRKASCFHPNVADYFRNFAKDRASMLDQVVQFVHEKQASEFAASGCPTDYVKMMEQDGFKAQVTISDVTDDVMISTFKKAYEYETNLGRLLALVFHHSEQTKEIELADFVAADLLPQVTKAINSHKNVIETVLLGTENAPDRYLKEFLFDKHIKK